MKKRNIYILVFVISVVGLMIVQFRYLQIGLNLASVQFSRNMAEAGKDIRSGLSTHNRMTVLLEKALQKDSSYFQLSIDSVQDASRFFLNDFITEKLTEHGITADFSYELYSRDHTYYLQSPTVYQKERRQVSFPLVLEGYLPELLGNRIILEIRFRHLHRYLLFQLNGLIVPGLIFLAGIIVVIIWVLRTYYWQRNLILLTNEFINNLTHELKTPVFSIGLASKMLDEKSREDQKPFITIIRDQVYRLSEHIDKVLELASLESGKKVIELETVDCRPALEKLCKSFKMLAELENVKFSYLLEEGPYSIRAHEFYLENAINNLLDNAKKYSEDPVIHLEAKIEAKYLSISVSDNGYGIDIQDQERIFKQYYRVTDGDKHKVKGFGLGLSYVKQVVDAMKGRILLESEKGVGTKISLLIPLV